MAEVTNYIDRLVAELCPDGVEYRPLGEICAIRAGGDLPESYVKGQKEASDLHPYPIYSNGSEEKALYGYASTYRTEGPAVTVSARGTIGYHTVRYGKFTPIVRLITLKPSIENLDIKFLDYCLGVIDISHSGGSIPQLTVPNLKKMEIPVPPMEVQEAIVEILDKFTNLEAELEAELEARTLQYEYYRDSLFEALDCPRVPLGSFTQYSKDRKRDDSTVSVYVGVENLKSDFQGCAPTESTNPGVVFQKGDILLGNIRPYLKKMWRADSDGVASPDVLVIRIRDEFSEKISSRYLYHLLASNEFVGYNVAHSRGGKMPRGNKAKILEFEAPIPSLEEQQRIVDILDRFDALTTSLSEGLPAELTARRSQYEYYRDQLLTFPRKGGN